MALAFALRIRDRARQLSWPRLAPPGLATVLALALALVTLVACLGWLVAMGAAQNQAARTALLPRLARGLAATAASLRDERSRELLVAEAATTTPGLGAALAAHDAPRALQLIEARHRALPTTMLAVVDASGALLAADPATNLPLAQLGPARQALGGQGSAGVVDGAEGIAVLAAAPVRQDGQLVGAVLAVRRLDDAVMEAIQRDSDLGAALLLQGRVVAASRMIRLREAQAHGQPVRLIPGGAGQPSQLWLGPSELAVASQGLFALGGGREITLVVGEPWPSGGAASVASRAPLGWGGPFLAAALAGLGGWLIGRHYARSLARLARGESLPPSLVGREVARLASALAEERAAIGAREAAAWAEVERLRQVLDSLRDGVIVSDANRRVTLANLAAQRLLGLPRANVSEEVIALLPPPEGSSEIHTNARTLWTYSVPLIEAGTTRGTVTVLHDATEERESERLKGEFLSVVSHELQTPLTAIVGAADLLLDGEPGELTAEQMRFLGTIRRNSHRLMALVSDLLDVTRLEGGRVELDLQPVDLGVVARSTVRSMANLFEQKSQAVRVLVDEGAPPALADRRRLEQILANLLANAGQYTPAGSQIEVAVRDGAAFGWPRQVVLSVADDGPGISIADQARIFDKFYRGSNAAARRERGSGLGLSIVRSLVELHGGRIWVESAPGRGTRFSIVLPAATDEDA